jgi:putative ABC transport system ATP-binding protein
VPPEAPPRPGSELEIDFSTLKPASEPEMARSAGLESVPELGEPALRPESVPDVKDLAARKTPSPPERMETMLALPRIGSAPEVRVAAPPASAEVSSLYEIPKPRGWYYAQSRPMRVGPLSDRQLQDLVNAGQIRPTDMVWLEGTPRWVPAGAVEGLVFPHEGPAPLAATLARPRLDVQVAVRCRGVTKSFGEGNAKTVVLRGVDLDVYTGQMTLMVGPSGCGKTTLMSVLAGTLEVNEGTINIFGKDLVKMSAAQKVRFRGETIGFVFQQFNLLPALTAAENAAMPLLIAGWSWHKAVKKASELLSKIGMGKRLGHYPRMLSGGQQQRVAIARALVHEPRLLVCDEPTSALDAESGHAVMELLREVAVHPQRAVIVVTHDSRIFDFSDRTIHMEDGRVVAVEEKPGLRMPLSVSSFEVRL